MRQLLVVISISLLTFIINHSQAQDETPPIIALNAGGIYAVTVSDGSAELLVPPPDNYQAIREFTYDPVTLFSAEWLSPDGQYLAYRVKTPRDPSAPITENTSYTDRLFLLDLQNGGVPLALDIHATAHYGIRSLAWSLDGEYLYLVIVTYNAASNTSAWALEILERDNWTRQLNLSLVAPSYAMARQIFATENGLVMWDWGVQSPLYVFTVFNSVGEQINQFEVDWNVSPDVNLYINTPFVPLEMDGTVRFGLVDWLRGEFLFQVDFASGEVSTFDSSHLPGMVSRSTPDSSLRLSPILYSGDYMGLAMRDAENNYQGEISSVKAYAFDVPIDNIGSQFTLAPDGQMLAYLQDDNLMLWQAGEIRALDFTAQVLAWSPPLYTPIYDPAYFRG